MLFERIRTLFFILIAVAWLHSAPTSAQLSCPVDEPTNCSVTTMLANGRWDMSQVSGSYEINGSETFCEYLVDGCQLMDDYSPVSGSLSVQKIGGSEENYIEVSCDGSVTGAGHEILTGTINKQENVGWDYPYCYSGMPNEVETPADMDWNVTIEKRYTITGQVTGNGTVDLEYHIDQATMDLDGTFAFGTDCIWWEHNHNESGINLAGDTEKVTLSGSYDSQTHNWQPQQTPQAGEKDWVDDVMHRLKLDAQNNGPNGMTMSPSLMPKGNIQQSQQEYLDYFIQDSVTVSGTVSQQPSPETPIITDMQLSEPAQYLQEIDINTDVEVTIDWRGQAPGQVEFTYGGTVETVAGSDTVTWSFNAGESGDTIKAVAKRGDEQSEPFTVAVPKVSLPPWAGSSSDWSGQSGITYEATLHWPVSLETTRTINTISLFSGIWGISGGLSSDYTAKAYSNGSPGSGDLSLQSDFKLAGKSFSLSADGPNTTTLSCDQLQTSGEATVEVPLPKWQKTVSPFQAVPGLQAGACAISGYLCSVINTVSLKATATASVNGTALYEGSTGNMEWTGGQVGGSISAKISAQASLPAPISSVAGVNASGTGSGCIKIDVAPDFQLAEVGGNLNVNASAWFMGLSTTANKDWPFGDTCGSRQPATEKRQANGNAFVPVDGQLSLAHHFNNGHFQGLAVWSELPAGEQRPSGNIAYRFYNGETGQWGQIRYLMQDAVADHAPVTAFDSQGKALIVYQHNPSPVPTQVSDLPAFANAYELHWSLVDPASELPIASGILTNNALTDFGPRLAKDKFANLHVFWQRANGIEVAGDTTNPVSIHAMSWDADTASWSFEETVAASLSFTYGWRPAAFSQNEQVLGLIIDTDHDFSTANDRELYRIRKLNGTWSTPEQISSNAYVDDSVLAAYDTLGTPNLLWRSDQGVEERLGENAGPGFPLADPDNLGGVGSQFSQGFLVKHGPLQAAVWPQGAELRMELRDGNLTNGSWEPSILLQPNNLEFAQSIYSLSLHSGKLWYGWARQAQDPSTQDFEPFIEPRFDSYLAFDAIFKDAFD